MTEEQIAKANAAAAAEAEAMAAKKREEAARTERLASWCDDEIRLLEKALTKFPVVSEPPVSFAGELPRSSFVRPSMRSGC